MSISIGTPLDNRDIDQIIASRSYDIEELIARRKREKKILEDAGILLVSLGLPIDSAEPNEPPT